MEVINNNFLQAKKLISNHTSVVRYIGKVPRLNYDPKLVSFGITPCDTTKINGEKFGGQSSGCHRDVFKAFMSTIGETVERYCPAFFDTSRMVQSSFSKIPGNAVSPSEFALFHKQQYKSFQENGYSMYPFNKDIELYWDVCHDIVNGEKTYCPSAFIYLPWTTEEKRITTGTSTGLAAHTNWHKALLTAIYEIIERDSFVLTWYQKIVPPKLIIDNEIRNYINKIYPLDYEWHFSI